MIITISGANFSASNIGTLSTWTVSKSIGAGAEHSIPSYVNKNSAFNYTITLKDGYTFGTYSVTMGGQKITPTVTETSITINIASVTGAIRIEVKTINSSTGEEDKPVTPDPEQPGTGGGSGETTIYYFKDTNPGYLEGGQYKESTKSGTTDYINISHMPKIGYYGRMGFVSGSAFHALEFYDSNKNYISSLSVLGTGKAEYINIDLSSDSKYSAATYVRASVSQSSFTDAEFNSWYFIVGDFAVEQVSGEELLKTMFPVAEYIEIGGTFKEASSGAFRTDFVDITGKTKIEYSGRMGTIGLNYAFYDANKTFISGLELVGDGTFATKTIDLTESKYVNAKYVVASISKGTITDSVWFSSSFKIS